MKKRALLLVNVGTPDAPDKKAVRRFLKAFLNDPRVIDIPWLMRKILVNLIIIPFRVGKSSGLYKRLWTKNGSPILLYLNSLAEKLQSKMPADCKVYGAMRYGNPSLVNALQQIKNDGIQEVTVLPLFPQYASSTTGTVVAKIFKETAKWQAIPAIRIVDQFYDHPAFINAFANRIKSFNPESFDHIIFSYHGLPERQITKIHPSVPCQNCNCTSEISAHATFCYKATCYATTRLLINQLGVTAQKTTTSFQSRLSKNWLAPFTDDTILALAQKGDKRILVVAPAFVADCLETIVEIEDYHLLFKKHGGQELVLVPSLNDEDDWVNGILVIVG